MQKVRIGDLLLQRELITEAQLQQAISSQQASGAKIGAVLVDLGFIEEDTLLNALAAQLELPYIDLSNYVCHADIVSLLPELHARRFRAIVLEQSSDACLIGMVDPQDIFAQDEISRLLGNAINVALVQETALLRAYELFYDYSEEINRFAEELSYALETGGAVDEEQNALTEIDAPVVKLLHSLFEEAMRLKASDIHIEPMEQTLLIRMRVDGVLQEQQLKERNVVAALIQRLKLMAGLNIAEKRLPQDGRFHMNVQKQHIDVRLATMPVENGEAVVMRLLRRLNDQTSLDDLHMPKAVLNGVRKIVRKPHGMFLVTGPTGSGKKPQLYIVFCMN